MHKVERVGRACVCGSSFQTTLARIKNGRGIFCSLKCARSKPVPEAQKEVQRQKMLGRRSSPNTEFKKGMTPWNKGKRTGIRPIWKGDDVGYYALHDWVRRELGQPIICLNCGVESGRIEWANKSYEYKRDLEDWMSLCKKCHIHFDRASGKWGSATRRYAL